MKKIKTISFAALFLISILSFSSIADIVEWTDGDYEIIGGNEWSNNDDIYTYNDVTVKVYGGGVNLFSMYDNSELTMHGGQIQDLHLSLNATATFFGGDIVGVLSIMPESTAVVKLYAYDVTPYLPGGPAYGGYINGRWLTNQDWFSIEFANGAYSHIQIIPEPATIALLGIGFFAIRKRRKR